MSGCRGASWESIARTLKTDNAPDAEIADRLHCAPAFVRRVRKDLGMRPWPVRVELQRRSVKPGDCEVAAEVERRYFELAVVIEDGHRRWRGRFSKDNVPMYSHKDSAYRVAFRIQHRREPVGQVRVECERARCVEGLHLSDQLMRERAKELRQEMEALDGRL
ncbi:hypothetical protein [Streptomyces griseofuscus]|uniref:Uncharacterized protein n=1 Tax=Streptomyces griseofuscus TaxID=146922 RepID=A0A7H1Q3G9_9ACTN|nr:hypothetical protein [Streptomyces griseofuscus]QNT94849.1 hypothetical protein HEP81_04576 [Streptomyces griseofuscus]